MSASRENISDKWEPTVHVVVRRAGTLPVYTVKPDNGDGPLRTLHRDLLLPCGYLPVEENSEPVQKPVPRRPVTRANPVVEEENSSDEGKARQGKFICIAQFSNKAIHCALHT